MQKEEEDENASQDNNSSILGGQLSDINSNYIRTVGAGNENDLESNFSNSKFKTANAALCSINNS